MRLIRALSGALLLLFLAGCDNGPRYAEIITVTPRFDPAVIAKPPRASRDRNDAMLSTFQTFDDLQVMTFFGDFDRVVEFQHHQLMRRFIGDGSGSCHGKSR